MPCWEFFSSLPTQRMRCFFQELTFIWTLGFPTCALYHRLFCAINLAIVVARVKRPQGNLVNKLEP